MLTDKQILSALMKWKKENRYKTVELQEKLCFKKGTYHRRINNGGWTHDEVELMKSFGIIT